MSQKEVVIKVQLDGTKGVVKNSSKVQHSIRDIGDESEKASKKMTSGFNVASAAAGAFAAVGITEIASRARELISTSYRLATSQEETASKYETVLGPSIAKANEFLEQNTHMMGLSDTQGKELLATTTAIAQGFDFSGEAAAQMGIDVVKLAADLQSFNDVPIEQTHNAITTALSGEREALKTLGIVIREADVQQRALANSSKESADNLTQQEKATATLELITERAGKAVGDLARTQDSVANKGRRAAAVYRTVAENLSNLLLPAFGSGVSLALEFGEAFNEIFEVPVVEQLAQQRDQFNRLYTIATNVNTSQQERLRLIRQMKQEYPDFLEGVDAETVSNSQLRDVLRQVNEEYQDRIDTQQILAPLQKAFSRATKTSNAAKQQESNLLILLEQKYRDNEEALKQLGFETENWRERLREMDGAEAAQEFRLISTSLDDWISKSQAANKLTKSVTGNIGPMRSALTGAADAQQELNEARKLAKTRLENLGFSQEEINELLADYKLASDDAAESTFDLQKWLKIAHQGITGGWLAGIEDLSAGHETLSRKIKTNNERIDELVNKSGELTEAERHEIRSLSTQNKHLQDQIDKRKKLTEIPAAPSVKANKPDDEPIADPVTPGNVEMDFEKDDPLDHWTLGLEEFQSEFRNTVEGMITRVGQLNSFFSNIYQVRINQLKAEKEQRLENINAELQRENISEQRREKLLKKRKKVEKKFQEKISEEKAKQFKLDKAANITRAAMQTSIAVVEALPNIPLSIAVGILGAAEIAAIASQPNPYFMGGQVLERLPEGMTSPGQKTITINETGKPEYVVNADSTRRMLPLLEYGNQSPAHADKLMDGFENGGPLGAIPTIPGGGLNPSGGSQIDYQQFARVLRGELERADITARADIKDIDESDDELQSYKQRIGNA